MLVIRLRDAARCVASYVERSRPIPPGSDGRSRVRAAGTGAPTHQCVHFHRSTEPQGIPRSICLIPIRVCLAKAREATYSA